MQTQPRKLFWLHIKKSAGITTRKLLEPHYKEVDRTKKPRCFIQSSPDEFNDILNNYRVVLGEYQFRRCLFAKKYLYKQAWGDYFSFAFAREPMDRCISMFWYLCRQDRSVQAMLRRSTQGSLDTRQTPLDIPTAFDIFLDHVQQARHSDSIYHPLGLHFTTHTAPVWEDISDESGNNLLTATYRLENLTSGINSVFEQCGIDKRLDATNLRLNQNKLKHDYSPTREQRRKIEDIYGRDFDVYESSL